MADKEQPKERKDNEHKQFKKPVVKSEELKKAVIGEEQAEEKDE